MNKIIMVFYVGTGNMSFPQARDKIKQFSKFLEISKAENIIHYVMPTDATDIKVECVNPILVANADYSDIKSKLDDMKNKIDAAYNKINNEKSA